MEPHLSLIALVVSPLFVVVGAFWVLRWVEGEHRRKSPMSRKVCRYPGYTLSKEVAELDENLSFGLTMLVLIPAISVGLVGVGLPALSDPVGLAIYGLFYLGALGGCVAYIFRTARSLRQKRLGLAGELLVGYQLCELFRSGFHVYHDVPLDFGNIDHVAVGPPGVFAIETKYRRKSKGEKDGHKMSFDGQAIRFPETTTAKPLEQAKRQAAELRDQLVRVLGEVSVVPVVVYPGWYVTREAREVEVHVVNDKNLLSWLSKSPPVLDARKVSQIAAFLEEKCRDVEV